MDRSNTRRSAVKAGWASSLTIAALLGACNSATGLDDLEFGVNPNLTDGEQGTPGAGGGTGGSVAAGGFGGSGGEGGVQFCEPGSQESCYGGPPGTVGVGICKAGTRVCAPDGAGYGECFGEVTPAIEDCSTSEDEDCDGKALGDAGCVCEPGSEEICYGGPPGTIGVGLCKAGTHVCVPEGTGYSTCFGEVVPAIEDCASPADEDCDGSAQGDSECVCVPGTTESCYTGPSGTQGISSCKSGTRACNADGKGYGACIGEVTPSAEQCATPADESCDGQSGCTGNHVWSNRFGDGSNQFGTDVTVDRAGNSIVAGQFSGSVAFGGNQLSNGNTTLFVAKFGPTGQHLWSMGTGSSSYFTTVRVTNDSAGNVVLGGGFSGSPNFGGGVLSNPGQLDVFVAKLDSEGNHLWSKQFGDTDAQGASALAVDSGGNVVIAGTFNGGLNFGVGNLSGKMFLAKLSPSGKCLWSKAFPQGIVNAVAVDGAGNIVFTGGFVGIANFGGGDLHSDGDILDVFVAKLDSNGNHLWSKRFGGPGGEEAKSIRIDSQENLLLTGWFTGVLDFGGVPLTSNSYDMFVAKLGPNGNHVWSKGVPTNGYTIVNDMAVDGAGNLALTGWFMGTTDFGGGAFTSGGIIGDMFLAKFDGAGNHLWSKPFSTPNNVVENGRVAVDEGGNIAITGAFDATTDFGGGPLTSTAGSYDVFVAKFAP
ncbi:MAG: hypothetical protein L6Q76_01265 [Polyangiaceae bacterium]|nr:hypothetical protein [Polyangiaceae bacterium]